MTEYDNIDFVKRTNSQKITKFETELPKIEPSTDWPKFINKATIRNMFGKLYSEETPQTERNLVDECCENSIIKVKSY